jgi:predicted HTH transcriptional regulator
MSEKMSEILTESQRAIERDLSYLQDHVTLKREGKVNDGEWITVKTL